MKGVILAAGVGSRLRPLTNAKPKCLVRVCGKAMLDYQLDAYRNAGIKDIFIVTGYEAQAVRNHCKHIKDLSITLIDSVDYESTNNMYSLYLLSKHLKGESFILNNGDLVIDPNIVARMLASPHDSVIAVDTTLYNDESMKVSQAKNGLLCDIAKTIPQSRAYGCSIDFYKFSKDASTTLFTEIERVIEKTKDRKQWTEVALQNLLTAGKLAMHPLPIDGLRWVEIDNYNDLDLAELLFANFDPTFGGVDVVFFDLDGTIFLGDTLIPGSDVVVRKLQTAGKRVYFLTNNSSKDKPDYVKRLASMGVQAKTDDIILSTDGLVHHLKDCGAKAVHVLGTGSLAKRLEAAGIATQTDTPEFVVVGYDTELTYQKLVTACAYINNGVDILATHGDLVCPTAAGPVPDAGALLQLLQATTGKKALRVFGKPQAAMVAHILNLHNIAPERAVMIGDRIYTDMQLAKTTGMQSVLVLSGETTREDAESLGDYPGLCVSSLKALAGRL